MPSFSICWKNLKCINISLKMFVRIQHWEPEVLGFSLIENFITYSIFLPIICLCVYFISFSFDKLQVSRNPSICYRLSYLLVESLRPLILYFINYSSFTLILFQSYVFFSFLVYLKFCQFCLFFQEPIFSLACFSNVVLVSSIFCSNLLFLWRKKSHLIKSDINSWKIYFQISNF